MRRFLSRILLRRNILVALACWFFSSFSFSSLPSEQWFLITIGGSPVGFVHETSSRTSSSQGVSLYSTSDMKLVINRLGAKVEMEFKSSAEESEDGILRKFANELKASLLATKSEAIIGEKTIEIRSGSGGKSYSRTIPYSGRLLGSEGIRLLSKKALKKSGDYIEFQTFAAELGAVTKGSRKVLAAETINLDGRDISTLKVEEFLEAGGVKSTAWLDRDYVVVKQEMPTPFGAGIFVLTDKERALAAAGGGELPAEIYGRSIIRSNIRLPKARDLAFLKLKLIHKNPELGWPDMRSAAFTVLSKDRETLILEIRRPATPALARFPVPASEANREFLTPNAYVQSDAPEIKAKAVEIIGGEKDLFRAAVKLRNWVSEEMTFDLGIAQAPALEIFANRRGTCLGYATLLATLARSVGIPSRVVMGYVYALGIFGGHAWTEILVGDTWIPLDSALPSSGVADAARLFIGATSMVEGAGSFGGPAAHQLFGFIDIKILEFAGADGRKIAVSETASPYQVNGDVYENPWLGIAFQKPVGAAFKKLDAVWPDPTVITLDGPDGAKVELRQYYLRPWRANANAANDILGSLDIRENAAIPERFGLPAYLGQSTSKAALVLVDRPEAWVLAVEGRNALKILEQAAAALKFGKPH
jgi:hypothetical protein